MVWQHASINPGVAAALGAALLFGAATPLAKALLSAVGPWLLAGLFYLGSGIGLTLFRRLRRAAPVRLEPGQAAWLLGAIASGGVAGPLLLMFGLSAMPASGASLLLNAEGVFTALLAWFAFRENVDRRIALGMALITVGALVLSWPSDPSFAGLWPALAVLGACLAWGIDNNLTRQLSLIDATWIAALKGCAAGAINLALAFATHSIGDRLPGWPIVGAALVLGFLAYGVSLALFVVGLRHLGTARTGAYFTVAPFFGALLALAGGEPLTLRLAVAGALMAIGIALHLAERHEHEHRHRPIEHTHAHVHDEHHRHQHLFAGAPPEEGHTHAHRHDALQHTHAHFPDAHHRGHAH